MRHWRVLRAAMGTIILAGCGGGGGTGYGDGPTGPTPTNPGGTGPGVNTNSVVIADQSFNPGAVIVPAGTTVTWQWNSCADPTGGYGACVAHNVTFDDGSNVASATQTTGTFSRTFGAVGTYKYHCSVHSTSMSGQVTVK